MKKLLALVILGGFVLQSANAVDLKQSKFTQVVNSVEIISSNTRHDAAVNDVFKMPDVLRTGPSSRAELVADDGTITRVGANTIFSFDPANRTIDMQQGSLLFHSPHGKGGGTIRTGSATASVIGTTIVVTCTPGGGFKVLDLEGEAEIRFLDGLHETLQPGQMTFILPGGTASPIIVFRLDVLTQGSLLINGFKNPLPSWPAIMNEITQQLTLLLDGRVVDTDLSVGDNATPQTIQVVMNINDQSHENNSTIVGANPVSTLPVNYSTTDPTMPLDPKYTQTSSFTPPAGSSEGLNFLHLSTPSSGFTADNIDIDTADINLAPFANDADFEIMAGSNLRIWRSLDFYSGAISTTEDETSLPGTVALFAGGTMAIAPNSYLEADTDTFGLVAGNFATLDTSDGSIAINNTLSDVEVENEYGDVDILSESDLTMENGSGVYAGNDVNIKSDGALYLGGESIVSPLGYGGDFEALAYGSVNLKAEGDLTLNDADVESYGENAAYDTDVCLKSYGGNVNIEDSFVAAGDGYENYEDYEPLGGSLEVNAAGNVLLSDDSVYAYSGTDSESGNINIYAAGTGDIEDSYLDAENSVDIESEGSLIVNSDESDEIDADGSICLKSDDGDVSVDDYDLYAGNDGSTGGNVNIKADNGNVTLDDAYIYAGSGDGTDIGNVNVESLDSLTVESDDSDYIDADGSISLKSEDGKVLVEDYGVYADGNVCITSGDSTSCATIDLEDSDIEAGDGGTTGGNINVDAYNGGVTINDTYIYAGSEDGTDIGNVNVESLDSLTVESDDSDEIDADGSISLQSDTSDVSVSDYGLYADGDVDITSGESVGTGGDIDIEDADIEAGDGGTTGGNINVNAYNGDVSITDTGIYAYSGENSGTGNVSVYANGEIDLDDDSLSAYSDDSLSCYGKIYISAGDNIIVDGETDLEADGNVDIIAGESGDSSSGTTVDIADSYIYAGDDYNSGGSIRIKSYDGDICLSDDGLYAYAGYDSDGNVSISSIGDVKVIDDTDIEANGSVYITAGSSVTPLEEDSSGYGDVLVSCSYIYAGYDGDGGGTICINAGGNVTVKGDSGIYAYDDVDINGGNSDSTGSVNIKGSTVYAGYDEYPSYDGGNVNINAYCNACLYDSDVEAYMGEESDNGSVNVYADNDLDAYDTYVYAENSVYLDGEEDLSINSDGTVGEYYIDGEYGVTLTSDYGDVSVNSYEIDADDGNVDISANGSLSATMDDTDTETPGSGAVDIENSDIYAGVDNDTTGSVCITAPNGGINLYDDSIEAYNDDSVACDGKIYISAGDNITIGGETDLSADGNVDIIAGESGDSSSGTTIDIADSYIYAGGEDSASDSGGSISIKSYDGDVCLSDDGLYTYAGPGSGGNVSISSTGDVSVTDYTTIDAEGNVCLTSGSSITPYEDDSSGYGDVFVSCSYIDAGYDASSGGDINVNAGGNVTIKNSHLDADDSDNIYAGISDSVGDVNIKDSTIYAGFDSTSDSPSYDGGNVTIGSEVGNICLTGSDVEAYEGYDAGGGIVNVSANGNINARCTTFYGDNGVSLAAVNGYVDIYNSYESSDLNASDWDVSAGTYVSISADDSVNIYGSSYITADNGDVTISSADSSINISDDTTINASGNVYLTAGGTSEDEIPENEESVSLDSVSISAGGTSDAGSIYAMADDGNVCIDDDSYLQAYGDANICATDGRVYVKSGSSIIVNGSISLNADGNVTVCDSYLSASQYNLPYIAPDGEPTQASYSSVTINSYGDLSIDGNDGSFADTGYDIGADHEISLYGEDGVSIDNAVIQTLNIGDDSETISVNSGNGNICINGSTLTGNGSVSVISDYGDISIDDNSSISAYGGDVTIGSGCETDNIKLACDDICSADCVSVEANGNIKVMDTTISAYDGSVKIKADAMDEDSGGMLSINSGNTFDTIDEISPEEVTYNIYASDDADLSGDCVSVTETAIKAGNAINIKSDDGNLSLSDVDLVTDSGSVDLSADYGDLTLESGSDDYGVNICADTGVNISATGDVSISDTSIRANMLEEGGILKVSAYSDVTICDSDIMNSDGNVIITSGDMNDQPVVKDSNNGSSYYSPVYIGFTPLSIILPAGDVTIINEDPPIDGGGDVVITGIDNPLPSPTEGDLDISTSGSLVIDTDAEVVLATGGIDFDGGTGVQITDTTLVGEEGDVDITADTSDVDIESDATGGSTVLAQDGNVNITATTGNVDVSGSDIEADSGIEEDGDDVTTGDVSITASGDVNIDDSIINAQQDVSVSATGGMLSIDEDRASIPGNFNEGVDGVDIYAGNYMSLDGECVSIQETALYSINDMDIASMDGNLTVQDAEMASYEGNVSLDAENGVLTLEAGSEELGTYIEAGGSVILSGDNGVAILDSTIYGDNGDVQITSSGTAGGISLDSDDIEAWDNVCITAQGDITLSSDDSDNDIYTDSGNITIKSYNGNIGISDSDIEANGNVNIGEDVLDLADEGSVGNVGIMDAEISSDYGTVSIDASDSLNICDSEIGGLEVNIESGGSVTVSDGAYIAADNAVSLTSDDSDVNIYDTTIDVGLGDTSVSGNNVTISAVNGDVNMMDDTINVATEGSTSETDNTISGDSICASGAVCFTANGGVVEITGENIAICDTDFNFGGNLTVCDSYVTAKDGDLDLNANGMLGINSSGTVSLVDDEVTGGNITVNGSTLTADDGNVNIANNYIGAQGFVLDGWEIDISGSTITAEDNNITGNGNVSISTPGIISISNGSDITANEYLNITAGGSIEEGVSTLEDEDFLSDSGNVYIDDSDINAGTDINAGGAIDISAAGNVSIADNSSVYASGNITISAAGIYHPPAISIDVPASGGVEITDSTIDAGYVVAPLGAPEYAGGNVYLYATGASVYLSDDSITATPGIFAAGDIQITAADDIDLNETGLNADGQVTLTAYDSFVSVYDSYSGSADYADLTINGWDITAGTAVSISADQDMEIDGGSIAAQDGDVDITSDDSIVPSGDLSYYDVTIDDGASISASGSVNVNDYTGDIDVYDSTLTATSGNVVINAVGNVDIENSTLSAPNIGEIDMNNSDVVMAGPIDITAPDGNVEITANGQVTLYNDIIDLGTDVAISGTTIEATGSGDVDISTGLLTISSDGTVDMTDCTLNGGSLDISSGSTITADAGNVNLDSSGSITVSGSTLDATPTGADVDDTGSNLSVSSPIVANGGNVTLTAVSGVTLISSTIDLGGNINISDSTLSGTGDLNFTTGQLTINAGGEVNESDLTVVGGAVNINDGSILTASSGDLNINSEDVNINDATVNVEGTADISTADTTTLSGGASLSANNVTITAANVTQQPDSIQVNSATIDGTTSVSLNSTGATGEVHIENGSTIETATLNINSDDGILIDGTGGHLSGNTMNLTTTLGGAADDVSGANYVTVQNTDLSGFAEMNVQAHTVNLNGDNFSSTSSYNFTSFYHDFYIGVGGSLANVAGAVNFNNDTLDNAAINNLSGNSATQNPANNGNIGLSVGTSTSAGIHIVQPN